MKTVELAIESGMFRDIKISPDVRVTVRDYDIQGSDLSDPDIRQDSEGKHYRHLVLQDGN